MIHLNDLVELKVLYLCIVESVVQLYFDILHGIKQKDVPLTTVVEFAVFLGYDGQLQQNSSMEEELFRSVIDQLEERFNSLYFTLDIVFIKILESRKSGYRNDET